MTNAARQSTALALTGSTRSASDLAQRLAHIAEQAHVIAPAMSAATLPEGCEVVTSAVLIDVANETYDVGGKRGLGKVALERIASAAGISWDPSASGRIDDGSDPYYCAWRAVGSLRHFDGTEVTIEGSKEMDLRTGSPQLEALMDRYQTKHASWVRGGRKGYEPKDPSGQIREMRLHIMAHAESKARLRAVRSIGIRAAYDQAELEKPFVVARLVFNGRSADPETQRAFSMMTAQAMLGGRRALYGGERDSRALPAPRAVQALPATQRLAPPPVGSVPFDDDDDLPDSWKQAPQARAEAAPRDVSAQQAEQQAPAQTQAKPAAAGRVSGFTIPGGKEKGVALEAASDESLQWWSKRIATNLDSGESRFPDKDQRLLDALHGEIDAREEASR